MKKQKQNLDGDREHVGNRTKQKCGSYPSKMFASTDRLDRASDANIWSNSNFFFLNIAA